MDYTKLTITELEKLVEQGEKDMVYLRSRDNEKYANRVGWEIIKIQDEMFNRYKKMANEALSN